MARIRPLRWRPSFPHLLIFLFPGLSSTANQTARYPHGVVCHKDHQRGDNGQEEQDVKGMEREEVQVQRLGPEVVAAIFADELHPVGCPLPRCGGLIPEDS